VHEYQIEHAAAKLPLSREYSQIDPVMNPFMPVNILWDLSAGLAAEWAREIYF
jgi:hypothetical protein